MTIPNQPNQPSAPGGGPAPRGGLPPQPGAGTPAPAPQPAPPWSGLPAEPPSGARRPRNGLAIAALVVAVLGAVFACVKGALVVGWVLLPVAFVLSIVALVRRGSQKGLAWAALAVTIVGTIAGVVTFTSAVGDAVDDAVDETFGTSVTATAPSGDASPAPSDAAAPAEQEATDAPSDAAAPGEGTRESPYPLGAAISSRDWTVTVNAFTADATDQVMAANQFNDPPADGMVYALANVTVTYTGDSSGYALETGVSFVTAAGNVIRGSDSIAVAPDALGLDELYPGASATGNVLLEIPAGDAGLLRVRPGILADEVFVALS